MICRNCGVKLDEDIKKCPFCGMNIDKSEVVELDSKLDDMDLELPILKNEEEIVEIDDIDYNLSDNDFEVELNESDDKDFDDNIEIDEPVVDDNVSLEKTRSISIVEDSQELNELSLIDDINKQIESVNEEAEEVNNYSKGIEIVEEKNTTEDEEETEEVLSTDTSLKKRKKILILTGIFSLILVLIIFISLYIYSKTDKKTIGDNYVEEMAKALDSYYNGGDIDDVIYVLEDVKKDPDKIKKVQAKTRTICDSWVLLYFDEKVTNRSEFDEISVKYKDLLNGLHSYAIVKNNNIRIKALTDTDYDELLKQVDDIYSDSTIFFDALAYYNKKDYNRAYYDFDKIEEDNKYYEKAISYKSTIISNILDLMKNDIKKIEAGLDDLTDNEKLQKYAHIESIIFEYNNVYVSVNLSDDKTYQELLSTYTSKVSEYTDKVSSSNENKINDNNGKEENKVDDNQGQNENEKSE